VGTGINSEGSQPFDEQDLDGLEAFGSTLYRSLSQEITEALLLNMRAPKIMDCGASSTRTRRP